MTEILQLPPAADLRARPTARMVSARTDRWRRSARRSVGRAARVVGGIAGLAVLLAATWWCVSALTSLGEQALLAMQSALDWLRQAVHLVGRLGVPR